MASAALETYKATRKAMYLVLARMHDMGMNPDIEKAQANEILSVNTFMLGQAFIGNDPKLKMKNPLENGCNITTFFDTIQSFFIGIPQKKHIKTTFYLNVTESQTPKALSLHFIISYH